MDVLPSVRCKSCGRVTGGKYNKYQEESKKSRDFVLGHLNQRFNNRNKGESLITIAYEEKLPKLVIDSIMRNKMSQELGDLTEWNDVKDSFNEILPQYTERLTELIGKKKMPFFSAIDKVITDKNDKDKAIEWGKFSFDDINWKYYQPIFDSFIKANKYDDIDINKDPYLLKDDERLKYWFRRYTPSIDDRLDKSITFEAFTRELISNYNENIFNELGIKQACCRAEILNPPLIPLPKKLTTEVIKHIPDYNLNKFNYVVKKMKEVNIDPKIITDGYKDIGSNKWFDKITEKVNSMYNPGSDIKFKDDNGWIGTLLKHGYPLKKALGTKLIWGIEDIDIPIEEYVRSLIRDLNTFVVGLENNVKIDNMRKLARNYESYIKGDMELNLKEENFNVFAAGIQNPIKILEELRSKELEVQSLDNLSFLGYIYENFNIDEKQEFEDFLIDLMPDDETKNSLREMDIQDLLLNNGYNLSRLVRLMKIIVAPLDYTISLLKSDWTVEQVIEELNDTSIDDSYKIIEEMLEIIETVGRHVNADIIVRKTGNKIRIGEIILSDISDDEYQKYKSLAEDIIKIVDSPKSLELIMKDKIISKLSSDYLNILYSILEISISDLDDENHIDFLEVLKFGYDSPEKFYSRYLLPGDRKDKEFSGMIDEKDKYLIDKSFAKPPSKLEIKRSRMYIDGFRFDKIRKDEKVVNGILLKNGKPVLPDTFEHKNSISDEFLSRFDQLGRYEIENDEEMEIDNLVEQIYNEDKYNPSPNFNSVNIEDSMTYFSNKS